MKLKNTLIVVKDIENRRNTITICSGLIRYRTMVGA